MQTTEIKCHGLYYPAVQEKRIISDRERVALHAEINRQRAVFRLTHLDEDFGETGVYSLGERFLSDEAVVDRIQSACLSRVHFEAFRAEWIQAALDDCARADHWYLHEKDWGNSATEPDPEEEVQE